MFRGTNQPNYASGAQVATGGFTGGALRVQVGGVNSQNIANMSGGWRRSFALAAPAPLTLLFRHKLTEQNTYETDEYVQMLFSLDNVLIGLAPNDYIARVVGGGPTTTGWQLIQLDLGIVPAGNHTLTFGAFNNQKTYPDEFAEVLIDDVMLQGGSSSPVAPSITTPPANATVTAAGSANFSVVAAGTGPLSYQWRRNGSAISGATSSSYSFSPTAVGDSGSTFDVIVSNSAGNVTSTAATLTVNPAPVAPSITTQPASLTVTAPAAAGFSVVAAGTAPLNYQWYRGGVDSRRDQCDLHAESDGCGRQRRDIQRRRDQQRGNDHERERDADGERRAGGPEHYDAAGKSHGDGSGTGRLLGRGRGHRAAELSVVRGAR